MYLRGANLSGEPSEFSWFVTVFFIEFLGFYKTAAISQNFDGNITIISKELIPDFMFNLAEMDTLGSF